MFLLFESQHVNLPQILVKLLPKQYFHSKLSTKNILKHKTIGKIQIRVFLSDMEEVDQGKYLPLKEILANPQLLRISPQPMNLTILLSPFPQNTNIKLNILLKNQ